MSTDISPVSERSVSSHEDATRTILTALAEGRRKEVGLVAFSSAGSGSVIMGRVGGRRHDEVMVNGRLDADVAVALGFTLESLGDWSKMSPDNSDTWLAGAMVGAAALMTNIDVGRARVAWAHGHDDYRFESQARHALLAKLGGSAFGFAGILRIDSSRLVSYDANGRLRGAVIALSPPHGIGSTLVDNLAAEGIETAADFIGCRTDPMRMTKVFLIRLNGEPVQVRGIGSDKAFSMCYWRQRVEAGHAGFYGLY